jgi:hypothetical protein
MRIFHWVVFQDVNSEEKLGRYPASQMSMTVS